MLSGKVIFRPWRSPHPSTLRPPPAIRKGIALRRGLPTSLIRVISKCEYGAHVESLYLQGEIKVLVEKPLPVPLRAPQISRDRIWYFAVIGWRLSA